MMGGSCWPFTSYGEFMFVGTRNPPTKTQRVNWLLEVPVSSSSFPLNWD
jgi:hypothetical protein